MTHRLPLRRLARNGKTSPISGLCTSSGFLRPTLISPNVSSPSHKSVAPPISSSPGRPSISPDLQGDPIIDAPAPPVPISTFRPGQSGELVSLPLLASVPLSDIPQLAFQKLKQCNRICDFSDPDVDANNKITKASVLTELISCYSNAKQFSKLTRECHQVVIEVFSNNVFRPLPKIPAALLDSNEAVIEETAWPHLRLVYHLFLQFLECHIDPRILQYHITHQFFTSLFAILDFPDARERAEVKAVIISIFERVPAHRPELRGMALNLLVCVSDGSLLTAASPLLDLLYHFTNDIPPPMSPQMISAFERVLLPLHLPSRCPTYFDSLVKCTLMMVRKNVRLGSQLIQFLRAHWPMTLDHKAQLFIGEAKQLLDESFEAVEKDVCSLLQYIAMAAESPCTRLALTALDFLTDNNFQNLYNKKPEPLLRIMFPAVYRIAEGHWQQNTQVKALMVMKIFLELNPEVFAIVAGQFKAEVLAEVQRRDQKKRLWEAVTDCAAKIDPHIAAWGRRDTSRFYRGGTYDRCDSLASLPSVSEDLTEGTDGSMDEEEDVQNEPEVFDELETVPEE
jgi:serine/threonine-protein phosphatase 2A regulatory subunit B'